jgi:transcriptional regulator with XRE-family HTH domain
MIVTSKALRFSEVRLYVHLSMSEANNGESLSRPGNYTGERLARERPHVYRDVMRLLSEGISARKICRACHVTRETVRAVERREAESISALKQRLAASAARVAQASIEQIEDDVAAGKVRGVQQVPVFGVCVDKLQALLGETGGVPVQLNLQVNAQLLHQRYQELVEAVGREAGAMRKEPLPNGETSSEPPALMGLQTGKENLQK